MSPYVCAGLLPDPEVSLGSMGIAFNTHTWIFMLGNGMAAAASTRVSNALGANKPDDAKLSAEARALRLTSWIRVSLIRRRDKPQGCSWYGKLRSRRVYFKLTPS